MSERTALITGASAGLGLEFAEQLAAQGYNLFLIARRAERLEQIAADLRSRFAVTVNTCSADLADPQAPDDIALAIGNAGVSIDYLVNNAGSAGPDLLEDRDWSEQQAFLQLMMLSVAQLCHLFIPGMRERGFGRVINVSSVAARIAQAGGCNYGPTKTYLVALSEELALTLKGTGVNVSALCPGFTHTDFHEVAGMSEMKASTPRLLWYSADVVVREGLRACERGKPVYISGRLYRLLDPFLQSVWTRKLTRL
jgi:short-subunit dehydrogenase